MYRFEQLQPSCLQPFGRHAVTHLMSERIQLLEGQARLQVAGRIRQRLELLVGRHCQLVGVGLAHLALVADGLPGKQAGAVVVDVGVGMPAVELVDGCRPLLRDVAMAEQL